MYHRPNFTFKISIRLQFQHLDQTSASEGQLMSHYFYGVSEGLARKTNAIVIQ